MALSRFIHLDPRGRSPSVPIGNYTAKIKNKTSTKFAKAKAQPSENICFHLSYQALVRCTRATPSQHQTALYQYVNTNNLHVHGLVLLYRPTVNTHGTFQSCDYDEYPFVNFEPCVYNYRNCTNILPAKERIQYWFEVQPKHLTCDNIVIDA